MPDQPITVCSHCGRRISSATDTALCPGCGRPLAPSQDQIRDQVARLSRQHASAGDRLGLIKKEYGDLQRQLQRLTDGRQTEREGARLQWESALEEERHLRTQAEAVVAELRIVRAEDMEQYLRDHQHETVPPHEMRRLQQLAEAALPLEARIQELERENAALQATCAESERTLLDAAALADQIADLHREREQLATRLLRAREEAARLLNEKLDLRSELDSLTNQFQDKAKIEQPFTGTQIEQARERIREAVRRQPPLNRSE